MKSDLFRKRKPPTISKHKILESYLEPWLKIISKQPWAEKIFYVDAFAGPGTYHSGETGSPLIAAKLLTKYKEKYPEKEFWCIGIEKERKRFEGLQKSLKDKINNIKLKLYNREFNDVIDEIIGIIRKHPAFFFLDPEGFSGMDFIKVKRILDLPHKEVFINFQYNSIQRWLKAEKVERTINNLFGTDKWKEVIKKAKSPAEKEKALIELYKSQLRKENYYVWYFKNKFCQKDMTIYYLVYASKNLTGFKIMKEVMFKEANRRYWETDLFAPIKKEEFKKELAKKFSGKKVKEEVVLEYVLQETNYLAKDMEWALKELGVEKELIPGKKDKFYLIFPPYHNPDNSTLFVREKAIAYHPLTETRCLKIVYQEYLLLDGKRKYLVKQIGDGSIIKRFDKTPPPQKPTDVVCPHFLELKWAYGCPFDCSWCYLKGTFRFRPEGIKPVYKPYEKIKLHTEFFLQNVNMPEILNAGEITDSLMRENSKDSFANFIIPIFESQKKHKVLFVTKSNKIKNLLTINPHNQSIVSFTLNAEPVAERWEKRAPPSKERILAARRVKEADYEVRIRIDPMVPIDNWQEHYEKLLDDLFANFIPERITLGSLRGLQSTINGTKDTSWVKFLQESSNWGKKIDFTTRLRMYKFIIDYLAKMYNYSNVALCKETKAMWEKLGMNWQKIRCNCVW